MSLGCKILEEFLFKVKYFPSKTYGHLSGGAFKGLGSSRLNDMQGNLHPCCKLLILVETGGQVSSIILSRN